MFNLAHIASYAIGAYTTALLTVDFGFSWPSAFALSILLPGIFAWLIAAISLRLSNDYFAIGTLACAAVVSALLVNWKDLTHGVLGIPGIPRPIFFGDELSNEHFAFFCLVITLCALGVYWCIFQSPLARALRATGQHEIASRSLGIPVASIKTIACVMASCGAGCAGFLFAQYMSYIDPTSFMLGEMVFILTICVVGRPSSFWGVIAGTCFMVLLPESLRFLYLPSEILGPMRQLLYAIILFLVVLLRKESLFPAERTI